MDQALVGALVAEISRSHIWPLSQCWVGGCGGGEAFGGHVPPGGSEMQGGNVT